MNDVEIRDEILGVAVAASGDSNSTRVSFPVVIETIDGDLFEVESVRFSLVGGGQIIIKALAYDDEFDPADASDAREPDADVEI